MTDEILDVGKDNGSSRDEMKTMFLNSFDSGEFERAAGLDVWIVPDIVGNHCIMVIPDYDSGTMRVDIETGIRPLAPEESLELYAFTRYMSSFRFKFGEFATAPDGEPVSDVNSWEMGNSVHLYLDTEIGAWDSLSNLVEMLVQSAKVVRDGGREISNGSSSFDVIRKTQDDISRRFISAIKSRERDN